MSGQLKVTQERVTLESAAFAETVKTLVRAIKSPTKAMRIVFIVSGYANSASSVIVEPVRLGINRLRRVRGVRAP